MIQTTMQRLTPPGEQWTYRRQPLGRGRVIGRHSSNIVVMASLLDRAVTLYWENRPDPRNCQTLELPCGCTGTDHHIECPNWKLVEVPI